MMKKIVFRQDYIRKKETKLTEICSLRLFLMTDAIKSLVLAMVVLAIFGTALGAGYYYTVELPHRLAISAPTNGDVISCYYCMSSCHGNENYCRSTICGYQCADSWGR